MSHTTNDIDALLRMLNTGGWEDYHAALTALVAERDSLRDEIAAAYRDRASARSVFDRVKAERDALQRRMEELEAQPPADRDLSAKIDNLSSSVSILTCRVAALESAKFVGPYVPVNPWNPYPTTPWIIYGTRTSDRIEESA